MFKSIIKMFGARGKKPNNLEETRQETYRAFLRHDYARTIELATDLTEANHASKQERLMIVISLLRLGKKDAVRSIFAGERESLETNPFGPLELWLMKLLLGEATIADVLRVAQDDKQRCQAYYYEGATHLTLFDDEAAKAAFKKCLAIGFPCVETQLAGFELRELEG